MISNSSLPSRHRCPTPPILRVPSLDCVEEGLVRGGSGTSPAQTGAIETLHGPIAGHRP
jgi:hypothetical protein